MSSVTCCQQMFHVELPSDTVDLAVVFTTQATIKI